MGNSYVSGIKPVPDSFGIFHIRFQRSTGVFSLLHADAKTISLVTDVVKQFWTGGVSKTQSPHPVVNCLQLAAYDDDTFFDDPKAYTLFCVLVERLVRAGWLLVCAPDFFLTLDDPELIFRRTSKQEVSDVFCLRPSGDSELQLIRGNSEIGAIANQVLANGKTVPLDSTKMTFALEGKPWDPQTTVERININTLLITLFDKLTAAGYEFLCVACLDADTDTFFFYKPVGGVAEVRHAMIGLANADCLFLQKFDKKELAEIRSFTLRSWKLGLRDEKDIDNTVGGTFHCCAAGNTSQILRINGHPWINADSQTATSSRIYFCELVKMLSDHGWQLMTALDTCKAANDLSAFLFSKRARDDGIRRIQVCGIQPSGNNQMQLINMPADIVLKVRKIFSATLGESNVSSEVFDNRTVVFKVPGSPWLPRANADALMASHVISVIIACLYHLEYEILGMADLQSDSRVVDDSKLYKTQHETSERKHGFMGKGAHTRTRTRTKMHKVTKTHLEPCDMHFIMFVKRDY